MEKIIFNCSLPKAGSELLQVLLHQNPKIYGSTTSPLLDFMFAASGNLSLPEAKSMDQSVVKDSFMSMCEGMARGWYAGITNRPIISDKSRGWSHYYSWIEGIVNEPKILCMVRDMRSILASFERTYRRNRHSRECPDNPSESYGITTDERIEHWIQNAPMNIAIKRLSESIQDPKIYNQTLFVRYEDLCNDPEAVMKGIYEYIDEEYYEHDFNNVKKEVYEDDSHFGIFGKHSVKPKILPIEPKPWSDVYTEIQSDRIYDLFSEYNKHFGYEK
jgi:sulfotransferase